MRRIIILALSLAPLAVPSVALAGGGKKKQPEPGWKKKPYVQPVAGASSFTNGDTTTAAAWAGAQAGIKYRQVGRPFPRIKGDARLLGTYMMSTGNVRGYEVRLGNFMGPQWKHVGIRTGPDLFYSEYQYNQTALPGTGGLAWPAILTGRVESFSGYAGVEPAWYMGDNRQGVDWSKTDAVGVGDEFSLLAGAAVNLKKFRVGLDWRRRTNFYGTDNSFGLSLNFNAFPGGRW